MVDAESKRRIGVLGSGCPDGADRTNIDAANRDGRPIEKLNSLLDEQ